MFIWCQTFSVIFLSFFVFVILVWDPTIHTNLNPGYCNTHFLGIVLDINGITVFFQMVGYISRNVVFNEFQFLSATNIFSNAPQSKKAQPFRTILSLLQMQKSISLHLW